MLPIQLELCNFKISANCVHVSGLNGNHTFQLYGVSTGEQDFVLILQACAALCSESVISIAVLTKSSCVSFLSKVKSFIVLKFYS